MPMMTEGHPQASKSALQTGWQKLGFGVYPAAATGDKDQTQSFLDDAGRNEYVVRARDQLARESGHT